MPFYPFKPPSWFLSSRKLFRLKQVKQQLHESGILSVESLSNALFLGNNA